MATAIIDVPNLPSGEAGLKANLVNYSTGVGVAGAQGQARPLTEEADAKTHYRCTTTAGLNGWHIIVVVDADDVPMGAWYVDMDNTATVHQARDEPPDLASDIWSNAERTLTQTADEVAAIMTGPNMAIARGDSWSHSLTGLGSLAGFDRLWFTIKKRANDADAKSYAQILQGTGLIYLNRANAATPSDGSITVDDVDAGDLTFRLKAAATIVLVDGQFVYDVKARIGTELRTRRRGRVDVSIDVTHAIE